MPKIVITHAVRDVENWLKYKEERAATIAPFGSNVKDHTAADGSKIVAVTADVKDMAVFQKAMASPPPEMAAVMERHGVIPPLSVFVEK
jgi:hypothetical protein